MPQITKIPPMPRRNAAAPLPPLTTRIDLVIKTAAGETRATALPKASSAQRAPAARPLATLRAGEKPQIRWSVANTDPKQAVRSLVVHFLVTKEEAVGAPLPPGPQKGSLMDSVLGTDLGAKGVTTGSYNTPIHEPGTYLVEVELLDAQGNRRHYCVLELKVEG